VLVAQAAEGLGSSSGILGVILSGALLTAIIGAYRFVVNFRTTERGLSRQRLREANQGERRATHEAGLWQARCADLEYLLRSHGIVPPPPSEELRQFVEDIPPKGARWDDRPPTADQTGGRPGP
jgi:hypothetical protein